MEDARRSTTLLQLTHAAAALVAALLPFYRESRPGWPVWGVSVGLMALLGLALMAAAGRPRIPRPFPQLLMLVDAALLSLLVYESGGIGSPLFPALLLLLVVHSLVTEWPMVVPGTLAIGLFYLAGVLAGSGKSSISLYDLGLRLAAFFLVAPTLSYLAALERRERERGVRTETLYEISTSLSHSLDLEKTLQNILESTDRAFDTDISSIRLLDVSANALVVKVSGAGEEGRKGQIDIGLGEGFIGWVAQEGQPLIINDISRDPRFADFPKARKKVASALAAPIFLGGQVVGVLSCASSTPRVFTRDDLQVLVTIANLAAAAIERAELFERIRTRSEVIVHNINSSIIVTDPAGRVTLINQAAKDLLGLGEEARGCPARELLEERLQDLGDFWEHMEEMAAARGAGEGWAGWSQELRMKGQGERVLLVKASPIRSSYDALSGMVLILDDITERIKVEEIRNELMLIIARRVEELSALYEMGYSLASMSDTRYMMDLLVNRAVEILGGRCGALSLYDQDRQAFVYKAASRLREELMGLSYRSGEGLPGMAAQRGEPMRVESMKPAGASLLQEEVPERVSALVAPILWRDRVTGVIEIFGDADRHVFSEDELSLLAIFCGQAAIALENVKLYQIMSEDKLRMESILLSVADGVVAINQDAQVILVNSEAERLLNLQPFASIQGKHVKEVIRNPDIANLLLKSLYTKEVAAAEITQSMPRETIMEIQTSVIDDERRERRGVVAVLRDITRMRRLEQAKSDFVSTVSHELRTPLTSIKAYTATLLREDVDFNPDTQREFLRIIEEETDRLTRLISDLLDVSRIESGKMELKTREFDFLKLLGIVLDKVMSQAEAHTLRTSLPESLPLVMADPDKIEQVLLNLLGNAVKYSPRGGEIEVSVKEYPNKLECSVRDQGVGIPREHLSRIFEKFSRVDNRATRGIGGTGLGLYITRSIVEAHGGTIWAESMPGKGSVFHFTLPLAPAGRRSRESPEGERAW
jgi:two-component system phosphate regulon sensor histidine kinase PhoR